MVADVYWGEGGSDPHELTVWNDKLYFAANDGALGSELSVVAERVFAMSVPEPTGLAGLVFLGAAMVGRRRRR